MQKSKSISEIYQEVKDFDIVITNNPALRDALNQTNQIAFTIKELAATNKLIENHEIAVKIANKFSLSLKQAQHISTKILNIWQNTSSLEQTQSYLTKDQKQISEIFKGLPTINLFIQNFNKEIFKNKKVAVIQELWLTNLEKTILPTKYTNINIFKTNKAELSQFYVFNSEKDIIERLTELITKDNQDKIAIITPKNSPLSSLAKSKLTSKGIKINHKTYLKEHFDVRLFLSLIELSFNIAEIKVKEILPYLELFDLQIHLKYNNYVFYYFVNRINRDANLEGFFSLIQKIDQKTYAELMLILNQKLKLPKEFQKVLKTLLLTQEKITPENFSELSYFIENFEINMNENKEGVLFIDATNSSFVNRPLCFFLGLDNSWSRMIPIKDGLNTKETENIEQEKFLTLIQQGQHQLYFVSEFSENQLTIPCYYFNLLFNTKISSFLEPIFKPKRIRNKKTNFTYEPEESNIQTKKDHLDLFSQSSFSNFVTCPKKYAYNRILPQEDQPHFLKGTLLHEFAEFYFEHSDFVKEKGKEDQGLHKLDEFVKIMVNKYKRINGDLNIDFEKTIFTIAVKNIIKFIDSLDVKKLKDSPFSTSEYKQKNIFAERFKLKLESQNTEASFSDKENGTRGIIDLIINQSTIVDYKSSSYTKSAKDIIKASNFNLIKDMVDFQPSFYIMELRKYTQDSEIKFIYNFLLANKDYVVDGKDDKNKNIVEVKYIPTTFNEFLTTKSAICLLASSKARSALLAALKDYTILTTFFKNNPLDKELQYNYDKLLSSNYSEKFHELFKEKIGSTYSTYEEVINSFLKTIVWIRTGERQKQALIFKEDIDEFEIFLKQKNKEINLFLNSKFPYQPINQDTCKNCDYKHICLKRFQ